MTVTENSLAHTRWECKYHVVFIPKYRKKAIFNNPGNVLGERFREFAAQKVSTILEGHVMNDHVHMLTCIPPKYSVSQVVGYIKGKSAIWNCAELLWEAAELHGAAFLGARLLRKHRGAR